MKYTQSFLDQLLLEKDETVARLVVTVCSCYVVLSSFHKSQVLHINLFSTFQQDRELAEERAK
jgi:hypothetical protein